MLLIRLCQFVKLATISSSRFPSFFLLSFKKKIFPWALFVLEKLWWQQQKHKVFSKAETSSPLQQGGGGGDGCGGGDGGEGGGLVEFISTEMMLKQHLQSRKKDFWWKAQGRMCKLAPEVSHPYQPLYSSLIMGSLQSLTHSNVYPPRERGLTDFFSTQVNF